MRSAVFRDIHRVLNSIAFWCVAALGALTAYASMGFQCTNTKDKAYVTAMKSDLRNLAWLQSQFATQHGRFATEAELRSRLRGSTGVILHIESAGSAGLSARARHERLVNTYCVLGPGDEPLCYGQEKRPFRLRFPTSNSGFNFALELWGLAFTLARRQRRLAQA
jgi:hypothetical protein